MKVRFLKELRKEARRKYIVVLGADGLYRVMEYNEVSRKYYNVPGMWSYEDIAVSECNTWRQRFIGIRVDELRKDYGRYRRIPGGEHRVF